MNSVFNQAARQLNHQGLIDWKAAGKPIVGYSCSFVPAEILHAAGVLPIRLRGVETDGMEIGDAYFGPYICSFPKCLLQLAGRKKLSFLDGVIITPGCDSMRRLYECWRKADEDINGILPPFFHYMDVPHKTVAHRLEWFVDKINFLKDELEKHFGARVGDQELADSIREYNRGRTLMSELEELRTLNPAPISGVEAFSVSVAGAVMPREEFNIRLESYLEEIKKRDARENQGKKRLLAIGSISDDIELMDLIESNPNAMVAADNLCFGVRHEALEISPDQDPIGSMAKSYLNASACPRMFGQYKKRLAILEEKIEKYKIDGVILQNIRFCDLHGSENGLFERDLEKKGVPCVRLEREYGPLTETGRLKMRLDAFIERISG